MNTVKNLCLLAFCFMFAVACSSSDDLYGDWEKSETFPGRARSASVAFTINNKTYIGLGYSDDLDELSDFWCYSSRWSEVDSFPGKPRYGAVAFSDGNYGYVGLGYAQNSNQSAEKEWFSDFYRFDPSQTSGNQWTRISDFPGKVRRFAVGFYVDGLAYVAMGESEQKDGALSDFRSYDPTTDTWSSDVSYFGEPRMGAVAWVIGKSAYICLGKQGSTYVNDFIKFTPSAATDEERWVYLDPFKNLDGRSWDNKYNRIPRAYACAFVIGNDSDQTARVYVATGTSGSNSATCWEYNPYDTRGGRTGFWDEITNLPTGGQRNMAVSFVYDNGSAEGPQGYFTLGGSSLGTGAKQSTYRFYPGADDDDQNDD